MYHLVLEGIVFKLDYWGATDYAADLPCWHVESWAIRPKSQARIVESTQITESGDALLAVLAYCRRNSDKRLKTITDWPIPF